MPEGDPSFGEVVGREFKGDAIARENADTITSKAAGQVSQNNAVLIKLNAK
jgi:hypothetical protein